MRFICFCRNSIASTGDIVEAIDRIVAELKGGQLDPAQEQLYLKMLVHLVGDLHQPMHTGHLSDRGGNSV